MEDVMHLFTEIKFKMGTKMFEPIQSSNTCQVENYKFRL